MRRWSRDRGRIRKEINKCTYFYIKKTLFDLLRSKGNISKGNKERDKKIN